MEEIRKVSLCLLRRGNEVLLGMKKKGFGAGKYNGYGGKPEYEGETETHMAVRELHEECGVRTLESHLQEVAQIEFRFPDKPEWDQLMFVYFVNQWEGEPQESAEMTAEWFELDSVPYSKMWEADTYWMPKVLEGKYVTAKFVYSAEQKLLEKEMKCE